MTLEYTFPDYRRAHANVTARVIVDYRNDIKEIRERNNEKNRNIRILASDSDSHSGFDSNSSSSSGLVDKPDLCITKLILSPSTPIQGEPVTVRVKVSNLGDNDAGSFKVRWWPGENCTRPGCTWYVAGLPAGAAMNSTCTYSGYPSWYSRLITKAQADRGNEVDERVENNNGWRKRIKVRKP